ncbi:MAG: ATP-binding protein [Thermodesulfobacteriota bacterium]|nr:ATP-binding protein [Thermodesulfobacteriota bacterium]
MAKENVRLKVWNWTQIASAKEGIAQLMRTDKHPMHDIEEQKAAQETAELGREQLLSIFDGIDEIIYIADPKTYEVLFANRAATHALGEEPVGKKCYRAFQGLESPCEFCTNDIILRGNGTPYRWEYRNSMLKKDFMATDRIITWPEGRLVRLHFARDITDGRRAEKEKKTLQSQLLQTQKMEAVATLAGGIAHDFNNILSVIVGNSELAIYDIPEDNPSLESLKEIRQACLRGRDLVRQILSFSRRTSQGRIPLKTSPIFKETLNLIRTSIPATVDMSQDISCKSDTALVDPTQINQVLINLCINAASAMEEKGGILEVTLRDVELDTSDVGQYQDLVPGKYLQLTVSDTGRGIDPELIDRIFDPYFTTKDVGEGTGLGLTVAQGIVKSHDGAITVESELGKGAAFHVFLPTVESVVTAEPETSHPIPKGNERILFVDDEDPMARTGKRMLEQLGYTITARTSSMDALEVFRDSPDQFDLVITDMMMPNMTGDRLARQLLQIRPDIPIILCTGYSERISEGRAKWFGISKFVMKPLITREIAETIRKTLDHPPRPLAQTSK